MTTWVLTPWERTGSTWGRNWLRSTGPKSEDSTEAIRITQERVPDMVIDLPVARSDGAGRNFGGIALPRRFSRVVIYDRPPENWRITREGRHRGPAIFMPPMETCKPPDAGPIAAYEREPVDRGQMDEAAVAMTARLDTIRAEADEMLNTHTAEGEFSCLRPSASLIPERSE